MFGVEEGEQQVAKWGDGHGEAKLGAPSSVDTERLFEEALVAHRGGDLVVAKTL